MLARRIFVRLQHILGWKSLPHWNEKADFRIFISNLFLDAEGNGGGFHLTGSGSGHDRYALILDRSMSYRQARVWFSGREKQCDSRGVGSYVLD